MARSKKSNAEKLAKLRQKLDKTDMSTGTSGGFWSPKEGRNTIRILPEVGEMEYFFQPVGRHQLGEYEDEDSKQIYCPEFTSEGELSCPVCEARAVLFKQGKQGDKTAADAAKELYVRRSYWMNVIDRDNEEAGPLIYTPGVTVMNAIAAYIKDPDYGDITDIYDGTDMVIDRAGKGRDTEYQVLPKRLASPLSEDDDLLEEWLDTARDLTYVEVSEEPAEDAELSKGHVLFVLPYERVQAEFDDFFGLNDDEDEEEEEVVVEKPRRRTRTRAVAKVEPEPEPEEVEDEEVVDEEPDEVEQEIAERKTRRTRRRTTKRVTRK